MSYPDNPRRDRQGGRTESYTDAPKLTPEQLETIIAGEADNAAQELVKWAQKIGAWLKDKRFSTSQIRNIFGEVRRLEQRIEATGSTAQAAGTGQSLLEEQPETLPQGVYRDLVLLKPKLAYQHGRKGGLEKERDSEAQAIGLLRHVLSDAIDLVGRDRTRFTHFVEFFEAILAYHRAAGGKN